MQNFAKKSIYNTPNTGFKTIAVVPEPLAKIPVDCVSPQVPKTNTLIKEMKDIFTHLGIDTVEMAAYCATESDKKTYSNIRQVLDYLQLNTDGSENRMARLKEIAHDINETAENIFAIQPQKKKIRALDQKETQLEAERNTADTGVSVDSMRNAYISPAVAYCNDIRRDLWKADIANAQAGLKRKLQEYRSLIASTTQERQQRQRLKNLEKSQNNRSKRNKKQPSVKREMARNEVQTLNRVNEHDAPSTSSIQNPNQQYVKLEADSVQINAQIAAERAAYPGYCTALSDQLTLLKLAAEEAQDTKTSVQEQIDEKHNTLQMIADLSQGLSNSVAPRKIPDAMQSLLAADMTFNPEDYQIPQLDMQPEAVSEQGACKQVFQYNAALYQKVQQRDRANAMKAHQQVKAINEHYIDAHIKAEKHTEKYFKHTKTLKQYAQELSVEHAQLQHELEALKNAPPPQPEDTKDSKYPPLSEFEEWVNKTVDKSKVVILPKAIKATKKSNYVNACLIYQAILLLQNEYWDQRISGKTQEADQSTARDKRTTYEEKLKENHLTVVTISDERYQRDANLKESYTVRVEGKLYFLKEHFRHGASTNKAECLRIYFTWDDDNKRVIVGSMPNHLPTLSSI